MNKSESIAQLSKALVAVQTEMKNPPMGSSNPFFKSKYASLFDVRNTVTPILANHGLAVTQLVGGNGTHPTVETVLIHQSGEWMSDILPMPSTKQDAQGWGSAISYARRYALMAICGVVGDEDDDGNAASHEQRPEPVKAQPKPAPQPTKTAEIIPKEATGETLKWFIKQVEDAQLRNEFMGYAIDSAILMPNETLEDWPLRHVPTSRAAYMTMVGAVEDWQLGKQGLAPEPSNGLPAFSEPFWKVICPIPRKGMKRDEYLKQPDTIESLYSATKTGDDESQKRLFGFVNNWKPEPREYKGQTYQPSDADHAFRKALDAFNEWETKSNGER